MHSLEGARQDRSRQPGPESEQDHRQRLYRAVQSAKRHPDLAVCGFEQQDYRQMYDPGVWLIDAEQTPEGTEHVRQLDHESNQ